MYSMVRRGRGGRIDVIFAALSRDATKMNIPKDILPKEFLKKQIAARYEHEILMSNKS